jgi:hypothetical protein
MENQDLRARVAIYAEALRQLTLDNAAPWDNLNADARIRHIHAPEELQPAVPTGGRRAQEADASGHPDLTGPLGESGQPATQRPHLNGNVCGIASKCVVPDIGGVLEVTPPTGWLKRWERKSASARRRASA